MLLVANIPSVSDNLHSANHLADGEETQDLGGGDTDDGPRLAVHAAEGNGAGEPAEFRGQCGGLAEGGDDRAEVLLEGSGRSGERNRGLVLLYVMEFGDGATYGGLMFWPRKTILESSRPTLE